MTSVVQQVAESALADRREAVEAYIGILSRPTEEPGDAECIRKALDVLGWDTARAIRDAEMFREIADAEADAARVQDLHAKTVAACQKHGEMERSLKAEADALEKRTAEELANTQREWSVAQDAFSRAASSAGRLTALREKVEGIRAAAAE